MQYVVDQQHGYTLWK